MAMQSPSLHDSYWGEIQAYLVAIGRGSPLIMQWTRLKKCWLLPPLPPPPLSFRFLCPSEHTAHSAAYTVPPFSLVTWRGSCRQRSRLKGTRIYPLGLLCTFPCFQGVSTVCFSKPPFIHYSLFRKWSYPQEIWLSSINTELIDFQFKRNDISFCIGAYRAINVCMDLSACFPEELYVALEEGEMCSASFYVSMTASGFPPHCLQSMLSNRPWLCWIQNYILYYNTLCGQCKIS